VRAAGVVWVSEEEGETGVAGAARVTFSPAFGDFVTRAACLTKSTVEGAFRKPRHVLGRIRGKRTAPPRTPELSGTPLSPRPYEASFSRISCGTLVASIGLET
jgi:hypothetical protein